MRRQATIWLVLGACALRLPGLFTDFWLDEIWALENVGRIHSALEVFTGIHHDSNHWLVSLWMYALGQDAPYWAYRLPSLLSGVAAVVVAGRLADAERSDRPLAMLLVAVSFPLGFYASEARGYAIAATAALASFLCLLRWLDGGSRRWLLLMWAASAAGLLAHLSFVAVLGAEAVFLGVLAIARQSPAARLLLPLSVPLAVLVALAVVDLRHLQLGGGPALVAGSLVSDLGALSAGAPLGTPWTGWLALVGGAGVLLLIGMRLRIPADGPSGAGRFVGVFYAAMILLPVATAISTNPPFLFPRYFLVSLAFVPLLLAGTLPRLPVSLIRAVVVAVIVLNAASWTLFWRDGRGGYATALSSMLAAVPEGTVTVASDHEFRTQLVLDFYRRLLGPDARRLAYVSTDAEFTIVTHVATPIAADTCGECRLFRDEPSSPLSGSRWRIYRRSP